MCIRKLVWTSVEWGSFVKCKIPICTKIPTAWKRNIKYILKQSPLNGTIVITNLCTFFFKVDDIIIITAQ